MNFLTWMTNISYSISNLLPQVRFKSRVKHHNKNLNVNVRNMKRLVYKPGVKVRKEYSWNNACPMLCSGQCK